MRLFLRKTLFQFLLLVGGLLFWSSVSSAACSSPSGNEGTIIYDGGQLKYCLGNNTWRNVNGTSKGGSCTNGTIQLSGTQLRFCRSGSWFHVTSEVFGTPGYQGTDASNSCTGSNTGEFYYDTARDFYVYCDGTDWHDFN